MGRVLSILRALRRKLTPPGSRGSLESEYRQPNGPGTHDFGGSDKPAR